MRVQLVAVDRHPIVQLTNGAYQAGSSPSSPDYADVKLLPDQIAFGDLNGDQLGDAAILLVENYGGTGVFVSVIAVLNQSGQPVDAGAMLIDDRPQIAGLRIQDRRIGLVGNIHGPHDPGCCAALPVAETFGLTQGGLALLRYASTNQDGSQCMIMIESPASGSPLSAGAVEVKGSFSITPFENALAYRVLDRTGKVLTAGTVPAANVPGSDGTFDSTVDLSAVPAGTQVRLEVLDVNAADGSTLALDSVELVIK